MQEILDQQGGTLIEFDDWGVRKLAYEIRKKGRGHYIRLDYCGEGAVVDEIERFYRIDDRILKFMTVLLEADADVDALVAEQAADAAEETDAASEAEAAPAGAAAETETTDQTGEE
jgi:small subunit ribosomal protein S6